jgi:hypothetical protein
MTTTPATEAQIQYIRKLRADKADWNDHNGRTLLEQGWDGLERRRSAGHEAFDTDLAGITKDQASRIIDLLKSL